MGDGGMRASEVLVATTKTAAELLGVDHDLGTIEPGKRADLVVVEGDPRLLKGYRDRVRSVYLDGELVAREA